MDQRNEAVAFHPPHHRITTILLSLSFLFGRFSSLKRPFERYVVLLWGLGFVRGMEVGDCILRLDLLLE